MKISNQEIELPEDLKQERVTYYHGLAQELLDKYGKNFDSLTEKLPNLLEKGDTKLRQRLCTGYNILPNANAMDLESGNGLIFYNNYIGRPHHFGVLLAKMEQEELIKDGDIKLGLKTSKVRFKRNWKPDDENEVIEGFKFLDKRGRFYPGKIDKTVETVVTFPPENADHALKIIKFLVDNTSGEGAIAESWDFPDMRNTTLLNDSLIRSGIGIEEVQANIIHENESSLIILKKSTRFEWEIPEEFWKTVPVGINEKLVKFLTYFRIPA